MPVSECHPLFVSRGKKVETTSSDSGQTAKYPVDIKSKVPSESETRKSMQDGCGQRHVRSFLRIRCMGSCTKRNSRHLLSGWVHHAQNQ